MTDFPAIPAHIAEAINQVLAELPQPENRHERDRWRIVSRVAYFAAAPYIEAAAAERLAAWLEGPQGAAVAAGAIRAQVDQEIATAVAAERERCAQMAEQEAAGADLQVASDEARIVGAVLRTFAKRLRDQP